MKNESINTTKAHKVIEMTDAPKNSNFTKINTEYGVPIQEGLTGMDIERLKHMQAFYYEAWNIEPSMSVIIRKLIAAHMGRIDRAISDLNKGIPIDEIPTMTSELQSLWMIATDFEVESDYMPALPDDLHFGEFPEFWERHLVAFTNHKNSEEQQIYLSEMF